jgi:hypothetical protein
LYSDDGDDSPMDEPVEAVSGFQETEWTVLGEHVFHTFPIISCGSAIMLFVIVYVCVGVEGTTSASKPVM